MNIAIIKVMNNEDISLNKTIETQEDLHIHDEYNNNKTSTRVNINSLMSKVRAQEKKQKKENIVFVGLVGSVIVITGIIASL